MIVAKTAQAAVACAEDIVLALSVDVQWVDNVLTDPMPGQAQSKSMRKSSGSGRFAPRKFSKSGGVMEKSQATSRTSSSHTRLTINQCVPQIYAGVHWAHVMIDDSQDDIVSYYGAGIATAASIADMAVDGQVVVSREVVDELNSTKAANGASQIRGDFVFTLLSNTPDDVTALSLTTPRFPEWLLQRAAARRKSLEEHGADAVGNTIAAAMATADGALAKRRIAVVSLLLRDLVQEGAEGRATVIREALEDLRDIVTTHRGEIHSISDGVVTVTIGASGPVAMAAVRAAQIATDASDLCLAAGVHCGPALVGNAMGGKPAAVGRIISGAALMRLVAARASIPVVASDTSYAELAARFQLATVDLIATPWDRTKTSTRCYAIAEARVDAGENEWLYEMEDGFAVIEKRFDECLCRTSSSTPAVVSPVDPQVTTSTTSTFLERHKDICLLSHDLYAALQQYAPIGNKEAHREDFATQRLVLLFTFAATSGQPRAAF